MDFIMGRSPPKLHKEATKMFLAQAELLSADLQRRAGEAE